VGKKGRPAFIWFGLFLRRTGRKGVSERPSKEVWLEPETIRSKIRIQTLLP
jgi:hypothetical protein